MEFSDKDNGRGIPFYTSIPYILITTNADCSKTGTLEYLPDLSAPRYAIPHPGYGANNLTISFANGVITTFGQQTDTKVPETLNAWGTLATAALPLAIARTLVASAATPPPATTCSKSAKLYKIVANGPLQPVVIPGE